MIIIIHILLEYFHLKAKQMTNLKQFNVYQVLLENIRDENIYKDIELPPVNIVGEKEQNDEDFECYGGCCIYPNEYYLNVKDEPLCKNCYIIENYDFEKCSSNNCNKPINKKNSIIWYGPFSHYNRCLECTIKDNDEDSLPKVCEGCYEILEEIVKKQFSKDDKISEFQWDDIHRPYTMSCDNCGTLCKCQEVYERKYKCYDCVHPEERNLRIKWNLLEEENKKLKEEIEKLKLHIKYKPDGEGALEAHKHFLELANNTK